jgi:hypothetical protein
MRTVGTTGTADFKMGDEVANVRSQFCWNHIVVLKLTAVGRAEWPRKWVLCFLCETPQLGRKDIGTYSQEWKRRKVFSAPFLLIHGFYFTPHPLTADWKHFEEMFTAAVLYLKIERVQVISLWIADFLFWFRSVGYVRNSVTVQNNAGKMEKTSYRRGSHSVFMNWYNDAFVPHVRNALF